MVKNIRKYEKRAKHPISLLAPGDLVEPADPRYKKENVGIVIAIKKSKLIYTKNMLQIFWINSGELSWVMYGELLINFEFFTYVSQDDNK